LLVRPPLGTPMPPIPSATPPAAAVARTVGSNVVLNVQARAGATVNVYRNGVLVATVPAAAAAAIKVPVAKGAAGAPASGAAADTFQVVVVHADGTLAASTKKTAPPAATATAVGAAPRAAPRATPRRAVKGAAVKGQSTRG
jgi:hypothetical protein